MAKVMVRSQPRRPPAEGEMDAEIQRELRKWSDLPSPREVENLTFVGSFLYVPSSMPRQSCNQLAVCCERLANSVSAASLLTGPESPSITFEGKCPDEQPYSVHPDVVDADARGVRLSRRFRGWS